MSENFVRARVRLLYDMLDDALLESRFSDVNDLFKVDASEVDNEYVSGLILQTRNVPNYLLPDREGALTRWNLVGVYLHGP